MRKLELSSMRIAFLLLHDQRFSGWQLEDFLFSRYHFAKDYAARVSRRGNDVLLYIFHQEADRIRNYDLEGYAVRVLPVSFRFPPFVPIGNEHNFRIVKELNEGSFDIVHFHNYYFWSLALVNLAKRFGKWQLVGQYHGEPELQVVGKYIHKFLLGCIDKFLVSTVEEIFWLKKLNIDVNKIVRFPNVGVNTKLFRRIDGKDDVPHFIYVGRMTHKPRTLKEKNPWIILDIAKNLRKLIDQFVILMVGDGPCLEALQRYSRKLELEKHVVFLGYKPHSMLPKLYSKCLFSFIPLSMWSLDPFWDGALKESLACETAVIGFNKKVRDFEGARKKFGLLLPTDIKKAAQILKEAVENPEYFIKAGVEGRKFIEKYCSWEVLIEKLLKLYSELIF